MANAKQCDICKKFYRCLYDSENRKETVNPIIGEETRGQIVAIGFKTDYDATYFHDICTECTAWLKVMVDIRKQEVHDNGGN